MPGLTATEPDRAALLDDPVELTRRLVRYDTTNPPGETAACTAFLRDLLDGLGLQTRTLARDPAKPNLVARLPGRGEAPPLVLHAHTDVVPTAGQQWNHDPFGGQIIDGEVWGRGTVDMKGGLAMMLTAIARMHRDGPPPAGDVLLAVVSDEEAGSRDGAGFLLREHRELFAGAGYAIGEEGGAGLHLGGRVRVHPIVVAEKRACWLRVTLRGPGGHASRVASPASPVRQLTRLLRAIEPGGLPPLLTPVTDRTLEVAAAAAPEPIARALRALRRDPGDEDALARLPELDAQYLRSVTRHSVNATVLHGGSATNVLPAEIVVELDGRLLPGDTGPNEFIAVLSALTGHPLDAEVLVLGEPMPEPVLDSFGDLLADVLREHDPGGVPVPMMTTASTDARLFPGLGLRTYGWTPMLLPPGAPHRWLLHAADERIPVDALRFGADCFTTLLRRYR